VAGIVPRGLGPVAYGNFSFLTDFFNRIFNFFDTGTSNAFYTKLSQFPKRHGIIRFYKIIIALIISIVSIFTILISISSLKEILWPKQETMYIILALGFAFLTWTNSISMKIIDAYALTFKGELLKIIQKIVQVFLIFAMFTLGIFTLTNYFVFQYFILLFLSIGFTRILFKNKIPFFPSRKLKKLEAKAYTKSFYTYSSPLILFSLFALAEGIFDRWLLQTYAGSEQQGFYGLALRISALCFIFTSAMMPLIMREFTIAFKQNNMAKIKSDYLKYVPLFFLISAYISIFISAQADKISIILGGKSFKEAHMAIMVMALYPIHQTFGQMNGSFFMGTNQTKIYSKIGIAFLIIGIPFTFFMIAPTNLLGLNLSSLGLAIKMVVIQLIGVNVELFFISKILKFSYWFILKNQFLIICVLGLNALVALYVSDFIVKRVFVSFFLSGVLYTLTTALLLYAFPALINTSRKDLSSQIDLVLNKINRKN